MPDALRRAQPKPPSVLLLAALPAALGLLAIPSCDSPACIFGGDCLDDGDSGGGGGGGNGSGAVVFPVDGEWIDEDAPSLLSLAPGTSTGLSGPLLLTFSESLNPASVASAFQIVDSTGLEEGATPSSALAGDGRALILLPGTPLSAGATYSVQYATGAVLTDLTGGAVVKPVDGEIGTFQVAGTPTEVPALAASYPAAGSTGNSSIGEVVLVFDRPIAEETVTTGSVAISVNGAPLSPAPAAPQVLELSGPGGLADTRVFTWRYTSASGAPIPLPAGATVRFELSPEGGDAIEDSAGIELPTTAFEFGVSSFTLPTGASILTDPSDAFGAEHLVGTTPLMIEVELGQAAQEGDELGVLLFGVDGESADNLYRPRTVLPPVGATSVVLTPEDLQLVESATPLQPIFADGGVAFAFRYSRGGAITPVRLLDVDASQPGVQDPVQDTVPPEFLGFGLAGDEGSVFRSDQYELALLGLASEEVRSVEVAATIDVDGSLQTLTNGAIPPVAGTTPAGAFVAAPIPGEAFEGLEGQPIQIALRVYDRALNAAPDVTGSYVRRGVVASAGPLAGTVLVRAFDVATVEPIVGASVYLHVRQTGGVGGPGSPVHAAGPFLTDGGGTAVVPLTEGFESIVTVDALGYDLFTFQGVSTNLLDVPLRATGLGTALTQSAVTSALDGLEGFQSQGADSRRIPVPLRNPILEMACTTDPFTQQTTCVTLPDGELAGYLVAPDRLGGFSYFATEGQPTPSGFDPADFIRAFLFDYPRPALEPSEEPVSSPAVTLTAYLEDLGAEEAPLAAPPHPFTLSGVTGFIGTPTVRARIESTSPGVPDPVIVGLALPFDPELDQIFDVRGAYPGAVDAIADGGGDQLGRLVQSQTVGDTLYLSMEGGDTFGNRSVRRAPIDTSSPGSALRPPNLPRLVAPNGNTGPGAFELVYPDVLPAEDPGLYAVVLTEAGDGTPGRAWRLWRGKAAGASGAELSALAPDLAALGATTLTPGPWTASVEVYSWPGLLLESFAWRELGRRAERLARTSPVFLSNP